MAGPSHTRFARKFDSEGDPMIFLEGVCVLAFSVPAAAVMKLICCSMRYVQWCSGEKFDGINSNIQVRYYRP